MMVSAGQIRSKPSSTKCLQNIGWPAQCIMARASTVALKRITPTCRLLLAAKSMQVKRRAQGIHRLQCHDVGWASIWANSSWVAGCRLTAVLAPTSSAAPPLRSAPPPASTASPPASPTSAGISKPWSASHLPSNGDMSPHLSSSLAVCPGHCLSRTALASQQTLRLGQNS